jgi:hypothetical protein
MLVKSVGDNVFKKSSLQVLLISITLGMVKFSREEQPLS